AAILAATLALLSKQSANARYLASCGALVLIVVLGVATAYGAYDGGGVSGVGSRSEVALSSAALSDSNLASESLLPENGQPTADNRLTTLTTFTKSHLPQIVLIWMTGVLLLS